MTTARIDENEYPTIPDLIKLCDKLDVHVDGIVIDPYTFPFDCDRKNVAFVKSLSSRA